MEKKIVYEFQRNKDERILVSRGSYKDRVYVDIRVFFTDPSTGDLRPTKKGLTLATSLLPQLKHALNACEKLQADEAKPQNRSQRQGFQKKQYFTESE